MSGEAQEQGPTVTYSQARDLTQEWVALPRIPALYLDSLGAIEALAQALTNAVVAANEELERAEGLGFPSDGGNFSVVLSVAEETGAQVAVQVTRPLTALDVLDGVELENRPAPKTRLPYSADSALDLEHQHKLSDALAAGKSVVVDVDNGMSHVMDELRGDRELIVRPGTPVGALNALELVADASGDRTERIAAAVLQHSRGGRDEFHRDDVGRTAGLPAQLSHGTDVYPETEDGLVRLEEGGMVTHVGGPVWIVARTSGDPVGAVAHIDPAALDELRTTGDLARSDSGAQVARACLALGEDGSVFSTAAVQELTELGFETVVPEMNMLKDAYEALTEVVQGKWRISRTIV